MKIQGIVIDNVTFRYGERSPELQNVSAIISSGSFVGITGVNGSGKSTFAHLLNGLIPHQIDGSFSGNVCVDGINTRTQPVSFFARKVGFVFQNPDFMIFNLTVYEEIAFGLENLGFSDIKSRIIKALHTVGLDGFEDRDPHTLSLGQKQKLCLAIAIAMDTEYVVLDEPTAMLDYVSALRLYELLSSLHRQGKTIIVIEHDTDFLFTYATHILVFEKGKVILQDETQNIFAQNILLNKMGIKIPRHISHG